MPKTLLTDKAELERDLKILDEKLSSALLECSAKDEYTETQAKIAQEAIAGREKAETEAVSFKQELGKALQQKVAGEERLIHLDGALRECMQQLRFVREEQEKRIHDAVMKTSSESEKTRIMLEEKITETSKRLVKLGAENTQLSKDLLGKEKVIEDLNKERAQAEADFVALTTRLESKAKENASLKYEVSVLEKELEIRNEEREFNRRTADVAHKQHLESVKKIAKLDSECQRLRLLVRKRLPGPAALAKMKNEVEILGRDPSGTRRKQSNPSPASAMDFAMDNTPETPSKRVTFLTEQLCVMEEENSTLKDTLNKKTNELQFFRNTYARAASKLSLVEAQLEESSRGQTAVGPARNLPSLHQLSLASMSEMGGDDKISCAESWASALMSELEHFRSGRQMRTPSCKSVGTSDIPLMDDFVEMEKLAIVSMNKPCGNSHLVSEYSSAADGHLKNQSGGYFLEASGREMVPESVSQSGLSVSNQEVQSMTTGIGKFPGWLNKILEDILKQSYVTQRTPDELLEDIKVALACINHRNSNESFDVSQSSNYPKATNPPANGYISLKPQDNSSRKDSPDTVAGEHNSSPKKSSQQIQSSLNKSILKTIELIEGISLPSPDNGIMDTLTGKDDSFLSFENSENPTGYMVRMFQWKTSELSSVLHQFVQTCKDLLNGKADLERFSTELTSALEWIMNHCFSLQDVSNMREAIKKHFDWDESQSESEVEGGMSSQVSEAEKLYVPKEQLSCMPIVSAWNVHDHISQMEELRPKVREESRRLKSELENTESEKNDLEGRLQSETYKNESLITRLEKSEKTIESLRKESEILKQSKGMFEEQIENHRMVEEDLNTQLTIAKVEFNKAGQKLSTIENALENKNNTHEQPESRCLEQQLQLESVKMKMPGYDMEQEEKQLRTDWEIIAASEKLAECQETILNLGKQLKALATPDDTNLFNEVISVPTGAIVTAITPKKNIKERSSLLDKMLAEDNAESRDLRSSNTKEVICTSKPPTLLDEYSYSAFGLDSDRFLDSNGIKPHDNEAVISSLAIVPSKKRGGRGLLKKLLWWRKKGNGKKKTFLCAT
ncbi:unnamed protein product [Ilex paraguariensis]|uniref:Filament-like plant protein 7 n=1 Tax=Ilex paraguariensis TaxID=185542 RepID=A0ABC8SQL3_9AQUA